MRALLGFAPVDAEPGESTDIEVEASVRPLQRWVDGKFELASRKVVTEAGGYAVDPSALRSHIDLMRKSSSHL